MRSENMAKIALNAVRLPKFEPVNGISWSPRKMTVKDLWQPSGLAWFCACAESCVVFNTGPCTVLPDNYILITANMQSETGFPSSHQLKSYVASKSRLKLAARAVLSADAGLLVLFVVPCGAWRWLSINFSAHARGFLLYREQDLKTYFYSVNFILLLHPIISIWLYVNIKKLSCCRRTTRHFVST